MDNLTGLAGLCNLKLVKWGSMKHFLNGKESWDDYAAVRFSANDTQSSLILSAASESEELISTGLYLEDRKLQEYYFCEYMVSCCFIKHDSWPVELLEKGMLDLGRFPALSTYEIEFLLHDYIHHLTQLNLLHQFYAFRKVITKCEFAMWEHAFSNGWYKYSSLSSDDLKRGIRQNLCLLDELKKDLGVLDPAADHNICKSLRSKLTVEIDKEYSKELLKFNERRIGHYNEYVKFRRLLKNRAVEVQAVKVRYLPKNYQLTAQLQPQSVHNYIWSRFSQHNDWIRENMSLVKDRVGQKIFGGLANRWSMLVLGGAAVFAFATASNLKKG